MKPEVSSYDAEPDPEPVTTNTVASQTVVSSLKGDSQTIKDMNKWVMKLVKRDGEAATLKKITDLYYGVSSWDWKAV